MTTLPSSHGSLNSEAAHGGGADPVDGDLPTADVGAAATAADVHGGDSDGFDSEEFREWLRNRPPRRTNATSSAARVAATSGRQPRPGEGRELQRLRPDGDGGRQHRRRRDEDSDDDRTTGNRGNAGGPPPPEWDGQTVPFQDWLIKARLWLATTRAKARSQGPMILQKLSGQPFQSFKHWARDGDWLSDERGGHRLLDAMNTPEYFGEDKEEELLSALAKLTYHLRRNKDEPCRTFFNRWDDSVRKTEEHRVHLPDKYLGFLLINALQMSEADIKSMMAFTRGSILVSDVKNWCRRHEMKLQAKEVGVDRTSKTSSSTRSNLYYTLDDDSVIEDEDELLALDEFMREIGDEVPGEPPDGEPSEFDDILDEHEVKEVLSTMMANRKKTFAQSLKARKAKALARGFGQWKDRPGQGKGQASMSTSGYMKGGYYRMTLGEAKAKSRCSKCNQIGHWHKDPECPKNQGNKAKEVNYLVSDEVTFCGLLEEAGDSEKTSNDDEPRDVTTSELPGGDRIGPRFSTDNMPAQASTNRRYKDRFSDEMVRFVDHGCSTEVCLDSGKELSVLWGETDGDRLGPGQPHQNDHSEDICATIDTGCQRMAIGLNTLKRLDEALPDGLNIRLIKQEHRFRSVHGVSKTTYVAAVPSSLGKKGSVLRPAVFDNKESVDAPFLISLPFLMHCDAVLHLEAGNIRIHFRKFGFSVACHIGPTGALRIPLMNFRKHMIDSLQKAQKNICNRNNRNSNFSEQ